MVRRICEAIDYDVSECQQISVTYKDQLLQVDCIFHLHLDGKLIKITTGTYYSSCFILYFVLNIFLSKSFIHQDGQADVIDAMLIQRI